MEMYFELTTFPHHQLRLLVNQTMKMKTLTTQTSLSLNQEKEAPNSSLLWVNSNPFSSPCLIQNTRNHYGHSTYMESLNQYSFPLFFSLIIASALVSFTLCLAAEFKKSKVLVSHFPFIHTNTILFLSLFSVSNTLSLSRKMISGWMESCVICPVAQPLNWESLH